MDSKKVISAAITGTSVMTLFSYTASAIQNQNYKEPKLLGEIIQSHLPGIDHTTQQVSGWVAHYMVGLSFAFIYAQLWQHKLLKPSIKNGVLIGAISGLGAIIAWKYILKYNSKYSALNHKMFFKQLVPAHVIFGAAASLGYQIDKS